MANLSFKQEYITPQKAQEYLACMVSNRKPKERTINKYLRLMERGKWTVTGEGIKFDRHGRLVDGQHRLKALIRYGNPVEFTVIRGLDDDAMLNIDTGAVRTGADIFGMQEVPNGNHVFTAIRRYFYLLDNQIIVDNPNPQNLQLSTSETYEIYLEDEDRWQELYHFATKCYRFQRLLPQGIIMAYYQYLTTDLHHPEETVKDFFLQMFGIERPTMNATKLLFDKLTRDRIGSKSAKMTGLYKQVIIIKTWNAFVTKKDLKVLSYSPNVESNIWFV